MTIRNIVFDLGGVLIKSSHEDWLKVVSHFTALRDDQELIYSNCNDSKEWLLRDQGKISLEAAAESICVRMPVHLQEPTRNYMQYWYKWREPLETTCALVRELKDKGYGIYLLSNVCDLYNKLRDHLPVLDLFDGEFISCECQLTKPDLEFYLRFLNHFALSAAECFFVDDNKGNVDAAIKAGFAGGYVFKDDIDGIRAELMRYGVRL